MPRRHVPAFEPEPSPASARRQTQLPPAAAGARGGAYRTGQPAADRDGAHGRRAARDARALTLLRVTLVAALALLIAVSIASYTDVERLVQDQRALNGAYALRTLLQSAQGEIRDADAAAIALQHKGTSAAAAAALRFRRADRIAAARRDLAQLRSSSNEAWLGDGAGIRALLTAADTLLASGGGDARLQALVLVRQAAARQVPALNEFSGRVESAAMREREFVWMRTCGMVALLGASFLLFWRDTAVRERQELELRVANRALARLAEQDGLTRLKNRRALEEKIRSEWVQSCRSGSPLSLVFVDVDRFKQYNDSFGHLAGDEVLKMVAALLRAESRTTDFVARYGGEEFAVLLPHTSEEEARRVAERLRASFEGMTWPGRPVTASVGIATISPDTADSPDALLYEADIALYFAKHNGRNRVAHADEVVKIR